MGQNQEVKSFTFNLVELPNGSVTGHGRLAEHASNGLVHFELSSFMFVGDSLGMAGEITKAVNAPPSLAVGTTIFFFLNDNDPESDDIAQGAVPPEFGNLTIQEIVALVGPPPPGVYSQLIAGDIMIF